MAAAHCRYPGSPSHSRPLWLGSAAMRCCCTARRGAGTLQFALVLAQAWLCEADSERKPCGRCGSCRLVQQRVHPDLFVLMPEVLRQQHAWPLADDKPESEEGKRKPSKQIRIAEVRLASDWVTGPPPAGAPRWWCCIRRSSSICKPRTHC